MKTALLLLEIQNDYFSTVNGRTPLEHSLEASIKAQSVLNFYREKNHPVIHLQHISTHPNASYFLPCTKGADFYSNVQPLKNETVFKKHYPNCFKDTPLLNYLNKAKIQHLVICGMTTQGTVDASVRAAFDAGFICTVLHDACAAQQLEFNNAVIPVQQVHHAFLAALEQGYAAVRSTDEYLQKANASLSVA
ncbi:MAG TPA: isochorismatase family protein [Gammaproteobacteria bacterium]|jgi:nicotinamidase-related amidase|nr:isochorismatase family protein [Gammaproteobacteria bacterium]